MLRSPIFWLLYVMLVLVSASGLMATAQLAPIAKDFGLSNTASCSGATTLSVALVVDNVMNGLARPFFGGVSDRIGREHTMALAFTLARSATGCWLSPAHSPWTFVICAGLIFFTWGEIFSLFPSTCTDLFGTKYATANAMLLYTAKGTSAFLVPLANVLKIGDRRLGVRCSWSRRRRTCWWCCSRCSCCGRCATGITVCVESLGPTRAADAAARVCYPGRDRRGRGSALSSRGAHRSSAASRSAAWCWP